MCFVDAFVYETICGEEFGFRAVKKEGLWASFGSCLLFGYEYAFWVGSSFRFSSFGFWSVCSLSLLVFFLKQIHALSDAKLPCFSSADRAIISFVQLLCIRAHIIWAVVDAQRQPSSTQQAPKYHRKHGIKRNPEEQHGRVIQHKRCYENQRKNKSDQNVISFQDAIPDSTLFVSLARAGDICFLKTHSRIVFFLMFPECQALNKKTRNRVVKGNQLTLERWAVKEFDFNDFAKGSTCASHV